ncbi:AraC family transcriptional regulator [Pararhodospirillum oryzae]|uniref:AraC family transcriptional regulator n=1 Tax=Pararhodospirillum oryzae TaxID=478448 RepID=UPI001FE72BE9|nr:AraC family transcriptional regulator [Pararhodospirillum oryzae]
MEAFVPGLTLHRWETPTEPTSYTLPPSLCLIAQGRKRVLLGEEAFVYDAHRFLMTSIDLPVVAQIIEATPQKPYLGLTLVLDFRLVAQLVLTLEAAHAKAASGGEETRPGPDRPGPDRLGLDRLGMTVSTVPPPLLGAFERLLDLQDHPEDVAVLAPLIKQEILYRLLLSDQGPRLRRMMSVESHGYQIARAIDWLKENYQAPFRVEDLARHAGLSPSAFHSHFRSMTAMSPLQFQKKLRLNEARRLMLTQRLDASSAALRVGYESPSQFSREYRRLFGAPPARDVKTLIQDGAP